MRRLSQPIIYFLDDLGECELAGDLAEELSAGRSGVWLWWQVGAATIAALFKTIRQHPYLTLRAVAVGWTTWILVEFLVRGRLPFLPPFLPLSKFPAWLTQSPFFPVACSAAALLISGWVVSRSHRHHRLALVLVTMLSMELAWATVMIRGAYDMLAHQPAYAPLREQRLMLHSVIPYLLPLLVMNSIIPLLLPLLVAVGGGFARTGNAVGDRPK